MVARLRGSAIRLQSRAFPVSARHSAELVPCSISTSSQAACEEDPATTLVSPARTWMRYPHGKECVPKFSMMLICTQATGPHCSLLRHSTRNFTLRYSYWGCLFKGQYSSEEYSVLEITNITFFPGAKAGRGQFSGERRTISRKVESSTEKQAREQGEGGSGGEATIASLHGLTV